MSAPGVTVGFSFPYRNAIEEWSQRYHFVGDPPADQAGWESLYDDLASLLAPCLTDDTWVITGYGYEDTDNDSVATMVRLRGGSGTQGELTPLTGAQLAPGDAAAWVRWDTGRDNTNGRNIYLRKYFHGVYTHVASDDGDNIDENQVDALAAFGSAVAGASGDWPGIAGPDHAAPTGGIAVSPFITTRTLKRRGARP